MSPPPPLRDLLTWNAGLENIILNALSNHHVPLMRPVINKVKLGIFGKINIFAKFCTDRPLSLKNK